MSNLLLYGPNQANSQVGVTVTINSFLENKTENFHLYFLVLFPLYFLINGVFNHVFWRSQKPLELAAPSTVAAAQSTGTAPRKPLRY
jgi:hypothetical protein